MKRAEALAEKADAHLDESLARYERFGERMGESCLSARRLKEREAKLRHALESAQLGAKNADICVLEAKLEARDAEIELLLLQWGGHCEAA